MFKPDIHTPSVNATVFSNNLIIGHAGLQLSDESMGCVAGEFSPNDNYYNYVQESVWAFWDTNRPDYKHWNSLNINIQLENGYFLHPIGGYTFEDAKELPSEPKRIDAAGLFRHVIEDFFLSHPPKAFVTDPWTIITIDQKLMFERESLFYSR